MIQCHAGWLLAYFVGIEGITLAMFPAVTFISHLRSAIQHFQWKSTKEQTLFSVALCIFLKKRNMEAN